MSELRKRLENGRRIVAALKKHARATDSTVAMDAAKQLSTLLRTAERHSALGTDEAVVCGWLEWAASAPEEAA